MSAKNIHSCPFQKGTFLETELLLSKAFLSMSKHGRMILIMLCLKCIKKKTKAKNRSHYEIINNGELELSYVELKAHGFHKQQAARGFDDVISKGFVRLRERGGKGKKSYNKYELIEDWKKYGTPEFKQRERKKSIGYGHCAKKKIDSPDVTHIWSIDSHGVKWFMP